MSGVGTNATVRKRCCADASEIVAGVCWDRLMGKARASSPYFDSVCKQGRCAVPAQHGFTPLRWTRSDVPVARPGSLVQRMRVVRCSIVEIGFWIGSSVR